MESKRNQLYLAALLHDIGKFYQRADTGSVSRSNYLSEHNKAESVFCPLNHKGGYTHKHCLWTAQFVEDYKPVFAKLLRGGVENELLTLAASHHLSKEQLSDEGKIIKEADCLSSGMDRESDTAMLDEQDETGWDSFKKKRMVSILESINKKEFVHKFHLPLQEITLTKDFFPKEAFAKEPDYKAMWEQFVSEFKFIQANTYKAFSETLLNLMYKYMATIPSSTINLPDVSLYDHSKTTAALAICLYDYYQENEKQQKPFLLIGADFSGIQNYIYQIVSKHAGKNLKGRSFYLRLLSDCVVRYLLKELNLFQANVIYNSGGGFYILAPNTKNIKDKLARAIETIEKNLFYEHGTQLFVAIDSVELSRDELLRKNGSHLGQVWAELFIKRDKRKSCKFSSLINKDYSLFFEPSSVGGESMRDAITGEEIPAHEKKGSIKIDGAPLRLVTSKQIELGKKLKETNYIVISEHEIPYWSDSILNIEPIGLGFHYYFVQKKELEEKAEKLSGSADKVSVVTLNGTNGKCDFIYTVRGVNNIYGFEFYGGNAFENSEFEEMCTEGDFTRLGVLRMDVDNLGTIFQKGILPERATLSRFSALSRSFDYFFSGYLNTVWEEVAPHKSFIIYSGGDDVFIIGSWEIMIKIAKKIREDFREFTCGNPSFSLSGGIAIVPPKFPVMKAADISDDEEKRAKSHECEDDNKNSLSFMQMPLNWDLEFEKVESLKTDLVGLIKTNKLPKSFLSKVMTHRLNAGLENNKITHPKTYWMLTYDLSRMKERYKTPDAKRIIENCIVEACGNKKQLNGQVIKSGYHALELWAFAARWAELESRTNRKS